MADGGDADALREMLAREKRQDTEKQHLHFYSETYPGIKQTQPMEISDDEQQNHIEMTENYVIEKIWTQSAPDEPFECEFYPRAIAGLLNTPVDKVRTMPVAAPFPLHRIVKTEVNLPSFWAADARDKTISDPAFSFRTSIKLAGMKLEMEYEYRALGDSAPADISAEHIQHLNDAHQSLGYDLVWW